MTTDKAGFHKKFACDAKFYKPGSSTPLTISATNLAANINDLDDIAFKTAMGRRLTKVMTAAVLGGRFSLDDPKDQLIAEQEQQIAEMGTQVGQAQKVLQKQAAAPPAHAMKRKDSMKTPDEKKLETFFEEFWTPFGYQVCQQKAVGTGFLLRTNPNETKLDLKHKIYEPRAERVGSDKKGIRWIAPESKNIFQFTSQEDAPHLDVLDWAKQWQWWGLNIDKSRMFPLCLQPREDTWNGIGDVEPCRTACYALYNLELGVLDRIAAWALQLLIFRVDLQKALGAGRAQLDELAKSMGHEYWKLLDKAEDLVQLNDKTGMGTELMDISLAMVSLSTGYPVIWLKGNSEGAITGSEVDLTQVQLVISNTQTELSNYIKPILNDYYGIDADELFWKMSIFTTAQAMQNQGPNAQKPGFGKPNPFTGGLKTPNRPQLGMKPGLTDKTPNDD